MCNCHSNFSKFKIYLFFHLSFSLQVSYENLHRYIQVWQTFPHDTWWGMIDHTIEYKVKYVVFYELEHQDDRDFYAYLVS